MTKIFKISDAEEQVKADFLKSNIPEDADMTDKLFNVPMAVGNKVQIEDEKGNCLSAIFLKV